MILTNFFTVLTLLLVGSLISFFGWLLYQVLYWNHVEPKKTVRGWKVLDLKKAKYEFRMLKKFNKKEEKENAKIAKERKNITT